jgi:hypothetical protein
MSFKQCGGSQPQGIDGKIFVTKPLNRVMKQRSLIWCEFKSFKEYVKCRMFFLL